MRRRRFVTAREPVARAFALASAFTALAWQTSCSSESTANAVTTNPSPSALAQTCTRDARSTERAATCNGAAELCTDGVARESVAIDRDSKFACQHSKPLHMIRMLVGDQDAIQPLGSPVEGEKSLADLSCTQPGVDQEAGGFSFKVGAVPRRTAAQNGKVHSHAGHPREHRCSAQGRTQ